MSSPTLHTFIIAAYGQSPYLEACIQSLLTQKEKSKVLITTSTPNQHIQTIANQYQIAITINPDCSQSIAADWNFALSVADTPWVTIAHQDDVYADDYTQQLLTNISRCQTEPIIAFTNYSDIINGATRKFSVNAIVKKLLLYPFAFKQCIKNTKAKQRLFHFGNPICCPSVTFNRKLLGNFQFSANYTCALDWLAWYQLAQQSGAFLYINKKLVAHRIHSENETSAQIKSGTRRREEQQIFELMWGKRFAGFIGSIYALGHKENL